jgi:hypothetical protein
VFAGGPYPRASDPSVAFDPKHGEWVVSYLALRVGGSPPQVVHTDLLASRSRDGLHWATPVIVALGPPGSFYDKNWTGCDTWATSPFYGRCYTEWDNAGNSNLALMSTSSDGGATWGPPTSPANKPFVIGGQPVALPNGTAVVPIIQFSRNFSNAWMASFISTNGGASWKASTRISSIQFHSPAGGLRADLPLPSAEVDQSGRVYVTWSDCRFEPSCSASDLVLTTSTDGVSWSPVRRIPLDPVGSGVDHFIPGIGVDRTTADGSANLAVTYYYYPNANCTTATCLLDVGMSVSTDGGVTWTPGQHVAGPMHLTWLPNTTLGYMVGDYVSTSLVPGDGAFGFFEVAAPPTGGTFHEDTFTAKRGLPGSSATSDQSAATTTGGSRVAAHWAG